MSKTLSAKIKCTVWGHENFNASIAYNRNK